MTKVNILYRNEPLCIFYAHKSRPMKRKYARLAVRTFKDRAHYMTLLYHVCHSVNVNVFSVVNLSESPCFHHWWAVQRSTQVQRRSADVLGVGG